MDKPTWAAVKTRGAKTSHYFDTKGNAACGRVYHPFEIDWSRTTLPKCQKCLDALKRGK